MLSELRFPIEKLIGQFEILNLESKVSLRGRLATSPTGYLHAGHAPDLLARAGALSRPARDLVLRVEDLDRDRCRPEYREAVLLRCKASPNFVRRDTLSPQRPQTESVVAFRETLAELISNPFSVDPASRVSRKLALPGPVNLQ
jgi:hypothetical protein